MITGLLSIESMTRFQMQTQRFGQPQAHTSISVYCQETLTRRIIAPTRFRTNARPLETGKAKR